MYNFFMFVKITLCSKRFVAKLAPKSFDPSVRQLMAFQVFRANEILATFIAVVRSLPSMDPQMPVE